MALSQLYETWDALSRSGTDLAWWQDFFIGFYRAFIEEDRWQQYLEGTGTTLVATALALLMGVILVLWWLWSAPLTTSSAPAGRRTPFWVQSTPFSGYMSPLSGAPP